MPTDSLFGQKNTQQFLSDSYGIEIEDNVVW
jgi:hypothetical protein